MKPYSILIITAILLGLCSCKGMRGELNDWAKQNSLKKSGSSRITLNSPNRTVGGKHLLKTTFSNCPKGSSVETSEPNGQPKTCRSETGVIFEATSAYLERYQNGNPKSQIVYGENTLLKMNWYSNGNPKEQKAYRDSKEQGVFKKWHQNGVLAEEGNYDDGELNGRYSSWDTYSKLKNSGFYHRGKKHGVWKTNGRTQGRETYVQGLLHGNAEYLNNNGNLQHHGAYAFGQKVGKWISYYDNGKWQMSGRYNSEGKKDGKWVHYSSEGKITRNEFFKAGVLSTAPRLASTVNFQGGDTLGARPPSTKPWKSRHAPRKRVVKPQNNWAPL